VEDERRNERTETTSTAVLLGPPPTAGPRQNGGTSSGENLLRRNVFHDSLRTMASKGRKCREAKEEEGRLRESSGFLNRQDHQEQ